MVHYKEGGRMSQQQQISEACLKKSKGPICYRVEATSGSLWSFMNGEPVAAMSHDHVCLTKDYTKVG